MRHPEILDALNGQSIATTPSSAPSLSHRPASPAHAAAPALRLQVRWARHLDEVRQAQRLRYQIFAEEMGAVLQTPVAGHDIDVFDDFCEHLMVCDEEQNKVIGTYRLLTPAQAQRAGGLYSDQEFDLSPINAWRAQMVELGRSCVHAEHRQGGVILALWGALAEFMQRNRLEAMVGCASIPMQYPGLAHGEGPARIWQQLRQSHLAEPELQVRPRVALPEELAHISNVSADALKVEPPALIQGYLRAGAKVLGAPAWDSDFNTADLPIMMRMQDLPSRYRRLFGRMKA
ncbi:GNAT family N-acetyltransferase [Comamonas testosteroni]|uniref:L-ornithine N(alpha)-acyltransferase n=1 Tax=Comamonas testosteroni TaxID=285 RepID=A0A8B4RX19_COMTE|nr:GNAT family N-acyltransferase [Comamonas testosteroni]QQN70645.1 GNAT family N-acetyltransferase [Comamonas testosteroni]SUY73263.1 N-acyl amino acid synthase, PEP-CTERM/exosortase system-associated [Comamonas testosteroni]